MFKVRNALIVVGLLLASLLPSVGQADQLGCTAHGAGGPAVCDFEVSEEGLLTLVGFGDWTVTITRTNPNTQRATVFIVDPCGQAAPTCGGQTDFTVITGDAVDATASQGSVVTVHVTQALDDQQ